jgi:hypothetical protein
MKEIYSGLDLLLEIQVRKTFLFLDIEMLRSKPKAQYNRYIGMEYLARKKILGTILKRMEFLFPEDYMISPRSFNYPEEEYFLEEHMK